MKKTRLILTFHDLKAENYPEIFSFLEKVPGISPREWALLLIPFIRDEKNLASFETFLASRSGQEILLHGYTHKSASLPRSWAGWLANAVNNNEAEFAGLNQENTQQLLEKSAVVARQLPLKITGFVPPTWFSNPHLKQEVFSQKLGIYESRFFLHREKKKPVFNIPLSWTGGGTFSYHFLNLFFKTLILLFPFISFRIALHPFDIDKDYKRKAILDFLCFVQKRCTFSTYKQLFNSHDKRIG